MERLASCFPDNVFISDVSIDVEWGNYSLLQAELECMRQLLNISHK